MKKLGTLFVSFALIVVFSITAFADVVPSPNYYYAITGPNEFYIDDNPKMVIPPFSKIIALNDYSVIDEDKLGMRIEYKGRQGYIYYKVDDWHFTEVDSIVSEQFGNKLDETKTGYFSSKAKIRNGPNSVYKDFESVPSNTKVSYEYTYSDWAYVRCDDENNTEGWVELSSITISSKNNTTTKKVESSTAKKDHQKTTNTTKQVKKENPTNKIDTTTQKSTTSIPTTVKSKENETVIENITSTNNIQEEVFETNLDVQVNSTDITEKNTTSMAKYFIIGAIVIAVVAGALLMLMNKKNKIKADADNEKTE